MSAALLRAACDERGFVVVSVIMMAMLLSLLAISLMNMTRSMAGRSSLFVSDVVVRAATEAGLNRAILAYSRVGDALRGALVPDGRAAAWPFHGRTLRLRAQAESGKLDLNAGDLAHLAALLARTVDDPDESAQIFDRVARVRSAQARISSVFSILSPAYRMTRLRDDLEAVLTVMTGQTGIDPLTAPRVVVETMPGTMDELKQAIFAARAVHRPLPLADIPADAARRFASERPIYTFVAETAEGFDRAAALGATVGFSERGEIAIYAWARARVRDH